MGEGPEGGGRREGADEHAEADQAGGVSLAVVDRENAKDGGEDGNAADNERIDKGLGIGLAVGADDSEEGDENAADQTDGIGFKNVRGHAGTVPDVIAHIIGDGGGVAGIIFFQFGFDFANEVGADVGGLGVDAAT